jgi:hypothetical protein
MVKPLIITQVKSGIASGASASDKYTPTEPLILKRVYVRRGDGNPILKSLFSLQIGTAAIGNNIDPNALGKDPLYSYPLNEDCPENVDITWTFTNNEGALIDLYVTFVFERKKEASP